MSRKLKLLIIGLGCCLFSGCISGRAFWTYVIDGDVDKPLPDREQGERGKPPLLTPYNVKVVYNDGSTRTEVLVPILSSGQQILIDHDGKRKVAPSALSVVPLPPTDADRSLEKSYVEEGLAIESKAPAVSIVRTHEKIRALVKEGNYALSLQYAEKLLRRYPSHVKTLQTKGSLLLKMGERQAALESYRRAQDIQPDQRVSRLVQQIEDELSRTGP